MGLKVFLLLAFIVSYAISGYGQNMEEYTNSWEGKIESPRTFSLKVQVQDLGLENAKFKISNDTTIIHFPFNATTKTIEIPFTKNTSFRGLISKDSTEINGFIKSGMLLYHLKLRQSDKNTYSGIWNPLIIDELKSLNFYLSIENGKGENYQAYPIFGDNRFTGTWCGNFQKENNEILFTDFKTGLNFRGELLDDEIKLGIYLDKNLIANVDLKNSERDWIIGDFKTENHTSILPLYEMEKLIAKDSLINVHSVIVSQKGEIIYENYFDGYNSSIPHDMRSASKSISSAIVGIAKDKSLFHSTEQSIFDFLPAKYHKYKDDLKSKIDIQSLLTMSSGLDAIDYGINANPKSSATEDNYQQPTGDWIESVLKASMINEPNKKANYGSANPFLLGIAMDSITSEPLELFMDNNLFQKLEISNYIIQTDLYGKPYFGGGVYMTPRDMMKFGELYLNKGKWKGQRILSKKWIKKTLKNYRNLENVPEKNGYGYLWWHNTYQINGKRIKSIEARGAGGQYIFVIPMLKTVVVITSGNYRNGKTQQPEIIVEKCILPHIQ